MLKLPNIILIISVLLIIAGTVSLFYYRTKIFETCEAALKRFAENHLCIATDKGNMIFELYADGAPKGVERIKSLSNDKKFYDGLEFYRVVKDFVIQGGVQDYYAQTGGAQVEDAKMKEKLDIFLNEKIDVEVNFDKLNLSEEEKTALSGLGIRTNPNLNTRKFEFGNIAYANRGDNDPNSNGTEFFIITSKDSESPSVKPLNGKFTNLGKIVEGQDILEKLNDSEINTSYLYSGDKSKPLDIIRILEMRAK